MYLVKKIEDITSEFNNYKLCYIEEIPQTYSDYTPETVEYMKTEKYEKDKEIYGWNNPFIRMQEYPNPDYIPGKHEYYAFFSPQSIGEVWGDDMDDIPYEHNSGIPYDHDWDSEHNMIEFTILKIPFTYPDCIWKGVGLEIKQPKDGHLNSPWSTEDINLGAVPWIFARTCKYKGGNKGVSVMAGINPIEFINKLEEINNLPTDDSYEDLGEFTINEKTVKVIRNKKSWYVRFLDPITNEAVSVIKDEGYYGDISYLHQIDDESWESLINRL